MGVTQIIIVDDVIEKRRVDKCISSGICAGIGRSILAEELPVHLVVLPADENTFEGELGISLAESPVMLPCHCLTVVSVIIEGSSFVVHKVGLQKSNAIADIVADCDATGTLFHDTDS